MSAASIVTTLMRQVEERDAEITWLRDWLRYLVVTYGPPDLSELLEELNECRRCRRR
jgi:hypothetical protein